MAGGDDQVRFGYERGWRSTSRRQRPMRMRTGRKAAAVLAVMAHAIAACGEGEETTEDPAATEDPAEDTEEPGEDAEAPDGEEAAETDPDVLNLGYILPETGQLAFLGPPMISGVQLAVEEINEAGGVLGNPIDLQGADEAGDTGIAAEEASRLLASGVDAIVGAAATGMTLAIIDQITSSGVIGRPSWNWAPDLSR
jgi:ABC-type branched-subunit amino acid transport system substrate-binding protein